jgi:hypothetical protein
LTTISGIEQAGGADDLLGGDAARFLHFVLRRRGRNVEPLADERVEFVELERPVVERGGQPEAMLDQHRLARRSPSYIPPICGTATCDSSMMVRKSSGKKVDQRVGPRAGRASAGVARIIFDAVAEAHLLHHFEVERGPHFQPLRLEQFPLLLQLGDPLVELRRIVPIAMRILSAGVT